MVNSGKPIPINDLKKTLGADLLPEDEWNDFARAIVRRPHPAIRLRDSQAIDGLNELERVPWLNRGRWLPADFKPGASWLFASAAFYIQDAASMLALHALDAKPDERVCDLCAAPGGKTTGILEDLPRGVVLANEPVRSRHGALTLNLARHGSTRFAISGLDPSQLAERIPAQFDAVLVDAPCTGQSLVARGKQSRASFTTRQIAHSAARQSRILQAAAELVRPGGRLVYCTCTFAREENEDQVETFLRHHSDWAIEPVDSLQTWQSHLLSGCYRLWPQRDKCGGAFAVRLVNQGGRAGGDRIGKHRNTGSPGSAIDLTEWGELENVTAVTRGQVCFGWPDDFPKAWIELAHSGPEIAFQTGRTWHPSYALAMRRDPDWHPRHQWSLTPDQACGYLQGHELSGCDQRGWLVGSYLDRPLGWLKSDGKRAKNHLPKTARLTKVEC